MISNELKGLNCYFSCVR